MRSHGGRRNAFTLIEILVVISIIALLAGLLVTGIVVIKEKIKIYLAKTEIAAITTALASYHRDMNAYPPDTADWGQGDIHDPESILKYLASPVKTRSGREVGPYLELQGDKFIDGKMRDPWGNPYEFDAQHMKSGSLIGEPYLPSTPELDRRRDFKIISRGPDEETDPAYPFDSSGTPDPATEDDIHSW